MLKKFLQSILHELTAAFQPGEWIKLVRQLRQLNRRAFLVTLRALVPQLVLYYILLSPVVAGPLYNMLLFHPTMSGPFDAHTVVGTKIENIFFRAPSGSQLHGWYQRSRLCRPSLGKKYCG